MKKIYLALFATVFAINFAYAQWTNQSGTGNYYFNSGNIGIGTTSPTALLNLSGGSLSMTTNSGQYSLADIDNGTSSPLNNGANFLGLFAGDLMLRSFWGVSIDLNNGSYGDHSTATYTRIPSTSSFTINSRTSNTAFNTLFTVRNNGNVGIGTTNPNSILQINGETTIRSSSTTDGYVSINPGGASNQGYINWWKPGNTRVGYLGYTDGVGTNNLALTLEASANFVVNGGNVGIASVSPVSLFQVDDGCTKASIGDASGHDLNYGTSYLGFNASRSGSNWLTSGDGGNNGGGVMYSSIFGDMYFANIPTTGGSGQTLTDAGVSNNIAMRIEHVDGAVYAKKIYVQLTGWPDYVFKKNYNLMPLAQLKSYIDQNHHLPGLPSDKEV